MFARRYRDLSEHSERNALVSPATGFVEARYVSDVVRGSDGVWRAVEFDLVVRTPVHHDVKRRR